MTGSHFFKCPWLWEYNHHTLKSWQRLVRPTRLLWLDQQIVERLNVLCCYIISWNVIICRPVFRPWNRSSFSLARSWLLWSHLWEEGKTELMCGQVQVLWLITLSWSFVTQRWFLYPPDKEPHYHPNRTTLSWLTEIYPHLPENEAPLECTISPGEVRRV